MANEADFVPVLDHFAALVTRMPEHLYREYSRLPHVRVETAFYGRHFILYQMAGRAPRELGRIIVNDLETSREHGLSSEIIDVATGRRLVVGYTPVKLWNHPVFVCIPLHAKVRWGCAEEDIGKTGSQAWPLVIRTQSRRHLREHGVTYCETGPAFAEEFEQANMT